MGDSFHPRVSIGNADSGMASTEDINFITDIAKVVSQEARVTTELAVRSRIINSYDSGMSS
jgi:hypothetical protein